MVRNRMGWSTELGAILADLTARPIDQWDRAAWAAWRLAARRIGATDPFLLGGQSAERAGNTANGVGTNGVHSDGAHGAHGVGTRNGRPRRRQVSELIDLYVSARQGPPGGSDMSSDGHARHPRSAVTMLAEAIATFERLDARVREADARPDGQDPPVEHEHFEGLAVQLRDTARGALAKIIRAFAPGAGWQTVNATLLDDLPPAAVRFRGRVVVTYREGAEDFIIILDGPALVDVG